MNPQKEILQLALAMYRDPLDYVGLTDPCQPLPEGIIHLLALTASPTFCAKVVPKGTDLIELRESALFFIKRVLLAAGADHYRVLGVPAQASSDKIKQHFRLLIRLFHPDRQEASGQWYESYAVRVNQAYEILCNSERRRLYDAASSTFTGADASKSTSDFSFHKPFDSNQRDVKSKVGATTRSWYLGWACGLLLMGVIVGVFLVPENKMPDRTWAEGSTLSQLNTSFAANEPKSNPPFTEVGLRKKAHLYTPLTDESPSSVSSLVADKTQYATPKPKVYPVLARRPPPLPSAISIPKSSLDPKARIAALLQRGENNLANRVNGPSAVIGKDGLWQERIGNGAQSIVTETTHTQPPQMPVATMSTTPPQQISKGKASPKNESEPDRLIQQFTQSYQKGDLASFVALFDEYAQANRQYTKAGIRKAYGKFFRSTKRRSVTLNNIRWQSKDSHIQGVGDIKIHVHKKGNIFSSSAQGTFQIRLKKNQGRLLIVDLNHSFTK